VLRIPRGDSLEVHVLDAKLRVERLESGEEKELGFKSDDLVKMHAYRDALPAVRSAFILYPGARTRFFPASDGLEGLQGVGAISLVPGRKNTGLVEHLRLMGLAVA
jgi:predicted component of viral defense system (DUF524 family)